MEREIQFGESKEVTWVITDPQYTPTKASVQFTLQLHNALGEVVLSSVGWRIYKGTIVAPALKNRQGHYVPTVSILPAVSEMIAEATIEWAPEFPVVQFPATKAVPKASK